MKPYTDYTPCDVFESDYDPFAQKTDYVPQEKEYHICMTEEQYQMLREAAEGKLDSARQELHDLKSSQSNYQLNGCGEDKYAEFVQAGEKEVEDWKSIVEAMAAKGGRNYGITGLRNDGGRGFQGSRSSRSSRSSRGGLRNYGGGC